MQSDAMRGKYLPHPSGIRIHRLAQQQLVTHRDHFC